MYFALVIESTYVLSSDNLQQNFFYYNRICSRKVPYYHINSTKLHLWAKVELKGYFPTIFDIAPVSVK